MSLYSLAPLPTMLALPKVEFLKTSRDGIDTISAYVASINIISSAQKGENKYPTVQCQREVEKKIC